MLSGSSANRLHFAPKVSNRVSSPRLCGKAASWLALTWSLRRALNCPSPQGSSDSWLSDMSRSLRAMHWIKLSGNTLNLFSATLSFSKATNEPKLSGRASKRFPRKLNTRRDLSRSCGLKASLAQTTPVSRNISASTGASVACWAHVSGRAALSTSSSASKSTSCVAGQRLRPVSGKVLTRKSMTSTMSTTNSPSPLAGSKCCCSLKKRAIATPNTSSSRNNRPPRSSCCLLAGVPSLQAIERLSSQVRAQSAISAAHTSEPHGSQRMRTSMLGSSGQGSMASRGALPGQALTASRNRSSAP
mmetsp:Transcript_109168/g.332027  ORF Transcript_109168/g.332027 Transcript_109168/m.332027 type:complete len:302 (+) Transcript_109168:1207-2112(+)